MTFSIRSIRSGRVSDVLVIIRARMLKEANRNSCLCCSQSSMYVALASFSRPARGSIFYNVPLKEGLKFDYELEPFNARDENSIVLLSVADCHLARKALAH